MANTNVRDYANSGLTIQYAMNDHATRFPDRNTRPKYILWNGLRIWTSDSIPVPTTGIVRAEFIAEMPGVRQGFDMKLDGEFRLAEGERVPLLRTWREERFEDVVEYPFFSKNNQIWIWNVYEMVYPNGEKVVEKWTENAGLWVEHISESERIYHCNHGMANPPDFDSLVFKVSFSHH